VEAHGFSRGDQGIKSEAALAAVPMHPQRLKAFLLLSMFPTPEGVGFHPPIPYLTNLSFWDTF
jgi:hypothetical protein